MKHVIIAGASRCGKTKLSKMLRKEYNFNHYKMDSIKRGIDNNFWDKYREDWILVSPYMAKLIDKIINENEDEYYVIDTCHLYPIDINKYHLKDTVIVFLGDDSASEEKKLRQIRKYDKKAWTVDKTDEYVLDVIKMDIKYSKEARRECEKLNIKYYDTSVNFRHKIKDAYNYIVKSLK